MAIYHYRVGFVSRSTGRSAVQSAAYISGNKLEESRREITADYRNRSSDIIFSETIAPNHAPEHMRNLGVWNSLESFEDQYAMRRYRTEETQKKYKNCAQIAQTTVVALPKELTPEVWKELVTDFVKERFVSRGLVVSVAIHNDEGNPHAHFQISRRTVTDKGEWSWTKDREITTKSALIESRKLWAEKTNFYLSREGLDTKVDHRSYADMGVPFEPTKHESWYAHKLEKSGLDSRIIEENKEIKKRNKEYLGLNPGKILKELTSKQATFSSLDLARIIQQRLGDDPKLASYVYEASLSQAAVVGMSLDGQARYTSQEYIQLESQALNSCQNLMNSKASITIDPALQETTLKNQYHYLSEEQQQSVKTLCGDQQLNILIGRAGTGKTTTLKAVVDLHNQSGYKVCGLSLSAVAAENLALETNCSAETVAFYLDKWERREKTYQEFWSLHSSSEHPSLERKLHELDKYTLTDQHLVIVDEAGMIGTSQWASILGYIEKAKSKLIVVGDDHQFKAIEAGDFFRKLKEKSQEQNNLSSLSSIIRQKEDWMRTASKDLAELRTYQALATYETQGHIKEINANDFNIIAGSYVQKRINYPEQNGLLLASTRAQCQALNDECRKILKERNLIAGNDIHINGRPFSIGDEIIFLKNDRDKAIACFDQETNVSKDILVKNGTRGKILRIEEGQPSSLHINKYPNSSNSSHQFTVAIDKETIVNFNSNDYTHFDHSYSITLYKAQGQTVDWSMVVASKNMDAHATYVALTRHRKDVTLFYDTETFSDFKGLQKSLSRVSNKDLVIDYTIRPEHQGAWENVQEYVLLGQDLSTTAKEKDWITYQSHKKERDTLGQNILSEWEGHLSYAHQAGLSKESIEIACGLKQRPLPLIEKQAQLKIQGYSQKAMEARLLWHDIRKTHPGKNCYEHSKYSEFNNLRLERNAIAKDIASNRSLYKEFVSKLNMDLGIGWKTLNNQAKLDEFSNKVFIQQTLNKYQLVKPAHISDIIFNENINKLKERIPLWKDFLGQDIDKLKGKELIEKTIIAEAIKDKAKKEYCFLSTPLEAAVRSEGIALITATLIQKMGIQNVATALEKGAHLYNDISKKQDRDILYNRENSSSISTITALNKIMELQNINTNLSQSQSKSRGLTLDL